MKIFSVCIDSNVFISGIAFGGKPLQVLEHGLHRNFLSVTSAHILNEVYRNLVEKLGIEKAKVEKFLDDFKEVSSIFVPTGDYRLLEHKNDNLVLETALMGGADILVTGDRKHLLPLKEFEGTTIEPPSKFLNRLEKKEKF